MPRHVLIVDDDDAIRLVLRMVLEDEGYIVAEAPDGLSALAQLRAAPYGYIVISNHHMPRLDGPGLLNCVAHDALLARRHRFIYFTANDHVLPPAFLHDVELLAVPIMRKPFDVKVMVETVDQVAESMPRS